MAIELQLSSIVKIAIYFLIAVCLLPLESYSLDIERTSHFDKWQRVRPVRSRTNFIIVHTTEAGNKSSFGHLNRKGAANYLITTQGKVYHIVHHTRVSNHAGYSMWNGIRDLNRKSVGIEFVGYHYKTLTPQQLRAGRELIRQLKDIYNLRDTKVLTHSMVAYGTFKGVRYRGRKDCGLNLANDQTRAQLGLGPAPKDDPDVPSRITGAPPFSN